MPKTDARNALVFSFIIFLLGASPYIYFLNSFDTFFDTVSFWDRIKGIVQISFHSLFFPCLVILISLTVKSRILLVGVHLVFFTVILSNSIYFSYFGSMIHLRLMSQVGVLNEVSDQIFRQLITSKELLMMSAFPFSLAYSIWFSKNGNQRGADRRSDFVMRYVLFSLVLLLVIKPMIFGIIYNLVKNRKHNELHMVKKFGFISFYLSEIYLIASSSDHIPEFPGLINPSSHFPQLTDSLDEYNVIFLQVESLDAKALYLRLGGKELTPNLNRLKKEMIYFPHFFAQHRGGASQDAELSTLFSILPVNGRSGYNSLRIEKASSLLRILKARGYTTAGFHANIGNFFNRSRLLRTSGLDVFYEKDSFSGSASGWNSKDRDFFQQSLSRLENLKEPFFAYFITMQSHGPFKNYGKLSEELNLSVNEGMQADYMKTIFEVDHAIGNFMESLRARGYFENTIVFIYADHESGLEYPSDEYPFSPEPKEHIPLLIYHPDLNPAINRKTGSHIDLAPTLMNLLNISGTHKWLGTSLFAKSRSRVILNYPRPIVYEFKDESLKKESDLVFTGPFIEWSEAMQRY